MMARVPRSRSPGRPLPARWRRRALEWLAVHLLGGAILPLLLRTWRIRTDLPDEWLACVRRGERIVLAFWHNRQVALIPIAHLLHPVTVLVSRHGDGEIIARIVRRFGVRTIRGSTTRGGATALRQMIAAARTSNLAITPDGPLGPRYRLQDGVIALAAESRLPIFWVSWSTPRAWRFDSWDRFILPKPFARISVRADGPMILEPDTGAEGLAAAGRELEARMREQTASLDSQAGLEVDPALFSAAPSA